MEGWIANLTMGESRGGPLPASSTPSRSAQCARSAASVRGLIGTIRSFLPFPTTFNSYTFVANWLGFKSRCSAVATSLRRQPESPINKIAAKATRSCFSSGCCARALSVVINFFHKVSGNAFSICIASTCLSGLGIFRAIQGLPAK